MDELVRLVEQFLSCLKELQKHGDVYMFPENARTVYVPCEVQGRFMASMHFNTPEEAEAHYSGQWECKKFVEVMQ